MSNRIAERIRREIEHDQQQMTEEMRVQLAADLIARDGYVPVESTPAPREAKPAKTPKQYERVGRFYLVKHSGWYGLVRVDGTGSERWCANKKSATETAWRITTREAEIERRG